MGDVLSLLEPSYLVSTGAGGSIVGLMVKTHLNFVWRELNYQRQQLVELQKEILALQRSRGDVYRASVSDERKY